MDACEHLWLYLLDGSGWHYPPFTGTLPFLRGRQCTRCGKNEWLT